MNQKKLSLLFSFQKVSLERLSFQHRKLASEVERQRRTIEGQAQRLHSLEATLQRVKLHPVVRMLLAVLKRPTDGEGSNAK